ncbi:hypothetical protein JYU13_00485 [Gammaproteobacteria bacterium AH-315-M22]|nr:hypothetical protein [Gammaproteobacteria bacterium AH-315-M22]
MKHILLVLSIALFSLFSISSQAELGSTEQTVVDMMLEGDLRKLKAAVRRIHDAEVFNTEVLDVAAEIMLITYPNTYKAELDTLSWLAKALGKSGNNRYYEVLSEVVDKTKFKKLRNHSKKSLKKLKIPVNSDIQYKIGMKDVKVPNYF